MKKDPRIERYIEQAQPFAQPILAHLRALVHQACPEVEETMKWSFPHFDYRGEMMCSMAAFKQHCVFGFWKASLMKDKTLLETAKSEVAMGHLGRMQSLKDLPADKKMIAYIKEAMKLNDEGIKIIKVKKAEQKPDLPVPEYFLKALRQNADAKKYFQSFSPSAKNEYVQWITEAKSEATRDKRMSQAIEWISEGKKRNWKYE